MGLCKRYSTKGERGNERYMKKVCTKKTIIVRDTRASNKTYLGRYLNDIDWSFVSNEIDCTSKLDLFMNLANTGINLLTPIKHIRINTVDIFWMTEKLKDLICKRQKAFLKEGRHSIMYKYYRNAVNRERKICKSRFYTSRIKELKGRNQGCGGKR